MSPPLAPASRKRSVAIVCFIPDYGHLQPLLKIADALAEAGFHIKCYIAQECTPLLKRFPFETFAFESLPRPDNLTREMNRFFCRSTFFNSVCLYVHYLAMYPRISANVGRAACRLRDELLQQQPDLIICDAHWFLNWYVRIAQSLGVRLLVNSFDGSLAYNQRPFVRTYGIAATPQIFQLAVELVSPISKSLCAAYYRLRFLTHWLRLRGIRQTANGQIQAAFPVRGREDIVPHWFVVGTAAIERKRLRSILHLDGATRREFSALKFRSSIPLPDDLQRWICADVERPIVYVSFGSAVEIDGKFAKAIYEGLRAVNARVLWSLPASQASLVSKLATENIRFESFVPQPEVLGMPNVRCFVTQAGPHSVQEALFEATPMLCIPFFADQAYNSSIVEMLGVGKRLWRRNVCARSVSTSINEILANREYLTKAREISEELFRNEGGAAISEHVADLLKLSPLQDVPEVEVQAVSGT